jgi:opacity protein-like surface antigen
VKIGRTAVAVAGLAAAAVAAPAAAQNDSGIYVGGSVGYSLFKDTCAAPPVPVPCDDHDETARVFAGYQFTRHWAAELGLGNLGRASGEGPVPNSLGGGSGDFKVAVEEMWDLTAVVRIGVVGNLSALGRAGFYRGRTKVDTRTSADGTAHEGGTNGGFTYGAGAEYLLFNHLGLRAEWQRYDNVGVGSTGEHDIDVFSLGLLWRF